MTSDPAIYEYISQSKNGEGGIYKITNLNLYHYAGNNPIKYSDPDGSFPQPEVMTSAGAVAVSTEAIAVQGIESFVKRFPILTGIFLILFLLRVLEIKCFNGKVSSYDLIEFARDFRLVKKGDGNLINISKNQAINEKIKKLTGLSNLDALYLTENEVDKLFKNCIDFI